ASSTRSARDRWSGNSSSDPERAGGSWRSRMLVKNVLRIVVSGALLAVLAWRMDWVQVSRAFAQLRPGLWLAGLALYLAAQLTSAARWRLLARPLGLHGSLWQFAGFYPIGMYF